VDVFRTPDERFDSLPGFPYAPRYREWEGLRLAHVDAGDGPAVVMLHGQPTWSYLFRKAMGPLLEAGYRCVAPDLPGFGRSDKPTDEQWYTYDRHTAALAALLEELDLRDVTLVVHDWGGPLGFRLATEGTAERITRLVAMDTLPLTGEQTMGEGWAWFRDLVAGRDYLPVGRLVRMGCKQRPPKDVVAGYDAPFPDPAAQAGVRAFPKIIPLSPDAPGAAAGRAAAEGIRASGRPALLMWASDDPIFPYEQVGHQLADLFPGAAEPEIVEPCGHFAPEDQGERIGAAVAAWLARA
jgi:haloalkane dehalogenase